METAATYLAHDVKIPDLVEAPFLADSKVLSVMRDKFSIADMTSIQSRTLPLFLSHRHDDFLIRAPTGSGKTMCYAVPIVSSLAQRATVSRSSGPQAIILVPNRELVQQLRLVFGALTNACVRIVAGSVCGGENKSKEKARIRKGINILIATPGRLADHLRTTKALNLQAVEWLVLDEADRLLELGFEKDLLAIHGRIREDREKAVQSGEAQANEGSDRLSVALVSATLNRGVKTLSNVLLDQDHTHFCGFEDVATKSETKTDEATAAKLSSSAFDDDEEENADEATTEHRSDDDEQQVAKTSLGVVDFLSDEEMEDSSNPVKSSAKTDEQLIVPVGLTQNVIVAEHRDKLFALISTIRNVLSYNAALTPVAPRIIVFFSSFASVDFHHTLLSKYFDSLDTEGTKYVANPSSIMLTFCRFVNDRAHSFDSSLFDAALATISLQFIGCMVRLLSSCELVHTLGSSMDQKTHHRCCCRQTWQPVVWTSLTCLMQFSTILQVILRRTCIVWVVLLVRVALVQHSLSWFLLKLLTLTCWNQPWLEAPLHRRMFLLICLFYACVLRVLR
jgi:superfamily II DNA/RNA helicase